MNKIPLILMSAALFSVVQMAPVAALAAKDAGQPALNKQIVIDDTAKSPDAAAAKSNEAVMLVNGDNHDNDDVDHSNDDTITSE